MRALVVGMVLCAAALPARADDVQAAREHYHRGTKAYDLGRYLEAAHEYEAAYEAKDDPALLFNIGQAYRLGNDYPNAIRAYRSFLRRNPHAKNRADIEARIAEMQQSLDQQARAKEGRPEGTMAPPQLGAATSPPAAAPPAPAPIAPAPPPAAAPAPPTTTARSTPVYKKWWLWTIVGVAAAGAAVGLGVGLSSGSPAYPSTNPTSGTFQF